MGLSLRVLLLILVMTVGGCGRSAGAAPQDQNALEVNGAPPSALIERVCSFIPDERLCNDALQRSAFTQLLETLKVVSPKRLFDTPQQFLSFIEGDAKRSELYESAQSNLGRDSPLLAWTPVVIPADIRADIVASLKV